MIEFPECSTLLLEQQASRLYITINRPEARNALSDEVVTEFTALLDILHTTREIRTVILRGAGGTFCAGGDIKVFQESFTSAAPTDGSRDPIAIKNRTFGDFLLKLNSLPQVLIAIVEGAAFGGGLGLVCVSDIAIGLDDTKFSLSETSLGIPPAQIAPFVVQRVGLTTARRIALSGVRFTGAHAHELGILHHVVQDHDALESNLNTVLNDISRCAPGANAATKKLLLDTLNTPIETLLDEAADVFAQQLRGPEGSEGVQAFLGKRPAEWMEKIQ